MTEHAHTVRVSTFRPNGDDQRAPLADAVQQLAARANEAPGCFGAQACKPVETPDAVAIVARWYSQDYLEEFIANTEEAAISSMGPLVAEPPTAVHYQSLA